MPTTKSNYVFILFVSIILLKLISRSSRDMFLPFLGKTALPLGLLKSHEPSNSNISITIQIKPNTKILYWASEPNSKIVDDPMTAYQEFMNYGVKTSNKDGNVVLKVREPSQYRVGFFKKVIKKHIHYRFVREDGLLSRIETVFI